MTEPDADTAKQPAFQDRTPWTAGAATAFTILTLAFAIGVAVMARPLHAPIGAWISRMSGISGVENTVIVNTMLTMLILQAVVIALVWWGAARFGARRQDVLSLVPRLPLGVVLKGLAGMAALLLPYNLGMYLLWPAEFAADLRPFWDLARSPAVWLGALVIAIGAPLSEELLFRGFLLPALTKTRYGFLGAAVLTAAAWTLLHSYSLAGMVEVFIIGLYFAWLMHRYANLWLPITLHALYNGTQLAVLALWPGT